ncbi:MAG: hypothetical protein NZ899_14215 [Thermoguttaceae bacterium]|nr:hypothetical protein [Thermoguttaceae bacterium]MDW8079285.1 hypothetical protein [Thermoguttaceae bacterium]
MNFLAHGYRWLDRPYFLIGTAVPDWAVVADRTLRIRPARVGRWCMGGEPGAELARGILQHLRDDACFHSSAVFVNLSAELTGRIGALLQDGQSIRPAFLGHLLTELLLDAAIAQDDAGLVSRYYRVIASVAPEEIEAMVGAIVGRATDRLAPFIRRFLAAQVLWDYLDDRALVNRINQVLRRVGLPTVSDRFGGLLPAARKLVRRHREGLLESVISAPAGVLGDELPSYL